MYNIYGVFGKRRKKAKLFKSKNDAPTGIEKENLKTSDREDGHDNE